MKTTFNLKNTYCTWILLCFTSLIPYCVHAQTGTIDYNPQYQAWSKKYQIDKIEHRSDALVIHFRFIRENSRYDSPTFNPSGSTYAWVLESADGTVYDFKRLTNIRRDDKVQIEQLGQEAQSIAAATKSKQKNTIFSCEIQFEPLPTSVEKVSLIEGRGYKDNRNHLNCLDILLDNPALGTEKLCAERIQTFENPPPPPKPKTRWQLAKEEDLEDYASAIIDAQPTYKKWQKEWILDKIIYTETEIIFLVRMVFDIRRSKYGSTAIFYPPNDENAWFLNDHKNQKIYPLKTVTNIRKDGFLKCSTLNSELQLDAPMHEHTEFTCRVHFQRPPNLPKEVHLIEGTGQEKNRLHFNFFKIQLKP